LRIHSPNRRYPNLLAEAVRIGRATGNVAFDAQVARLGVEGGQCRSVRAVVFPSRVLGAGSHFSEKPSIH